MLEIVKTLPDLEEIVGMPVANASMYSDELQQYCEQKGIKTPFNERSKKIKNKIDQILTDIITEDMTESQKEYTITTYVLDHMSYDFDNVGAKKNHEDALETAMLYDRGVCEGYSEKLNALLIESGVKNTYETGGFKHAWNLVCRNGKYYLIDATNIDDQTYEKDGEIHSWDRRWERFYLVSLSNSSYDIADLIEDDGGSSSWYPDKLPKNAQKQFETSVKEEVVEGNKSKQGKESLKLNSMIIVEDDDDIIEKSKKSHSIASVPQEKSGFDKYIEHLKKLGKCVVLSKEVSDKIENLVIEESKEQVESLEESVKKVRLIEELQNLKDLKTKLLKRLEELISKIQLEEKNTLR